MTEDDFHDWLAGLPEKLRTVVEREGFAHNKTALPLRRHALERRDQGYEAFLQTVLSPADWAYEQSLRQPPTAAAPGEG